MLSPAGYRSGNRDFVLTNNRGDDRFSPGVKNQVSLDWQVDLDSHWMAYVEGRWHGENGYRAGTSDWRSVLCCVACLSRLPEFLKFFDDLGKNCVMDFSARGTLSPSDSVAVGPDGTLSSSDLAGVLFPAVLTRIPFPVGPAGPIGCMGCCPRLTLLL